MELLEVLLWVLGFLLGVYCLGVLIMILALALGHTSDVITTLWDHYFD